MPVSEKIKAALKRIAEAKASAGGNHIVDGKYKFLIENVILEEKESGDCFIVELFVLESQQTVEGVKPNALHSRCGMVCNLTTNKSATGNAKAFTLAALGFSGGDVSDDDFLEALTEVVGDSKPLRGMVIGAETYQKVTKGGANKGKVGTYPRWITLDNTPEQIAANIKQYLTTNAKAA